MKKITFNQVMSTITSLKKESTDIAVGYASGHVRLINFQTNVRTKSFNPDVMNNLVEWIDFNCNDEYVVVLYDNGHIRTFNVKTGVQSEKIKVENSIGMIRYHNAKPHVMCMASRNGAIYIWDSLKKRQIYKDSEAHNAPIRDVGWDLTNPDILYTGGYDCCVKVFDIRKRFCELKIKNQHPVNCFNVSACGNFITTGNLVGAVHLYDKRNPKNFLYETDLSDSKSSNVQRIIVVPGHHEISLHSEQTNVSIAESQMETSPANVTPNTEIDNLIAEAKNTKTRVSIGENMSDSLMSIGSNRLAAGRRSSIGFGGKRLSADFGAQNLMRYLDLSTESIDSPIIISPASDSLKNQRRSLQNISDNAIKAQPEPISTTPKSTTVSRLSALKKVDETDESESFSTPPSSVETNTIENKENTPFIPTGHTSTPNISGPISKQITSIDSDSEKPTPPTLTQSNTFSCNDLSQILTAINGLGTRLDQMNSRMDKLEENIKEQVIQAQFRLQEEHYDRFWGIHNTLLLQARLIKEKISEVDEGINVVGAYLNLACPLPNDGNSANLPLNAEKYHDMNEEWEKQFH